MNICVEKLKSTYCPIEGWKETDNCLNCKFFGGLFLNSQNGRLNIAIECNKK